MLTLNKQIIMTLSFVLVVATCLLMTEEFFLNAYGECENSCSGEPLYLTPLIQAGLLAEGRNKSRVEFPAFHGVESYSGFLTVDEARSSNSFFWYFPAENHAENAPVLLWLQGGPGAPSTYGLFFENGPFTFKNGSVERRNCSWTEKNHVIYIDNPVGTGFSWTESGFAQNETVVGNNLYSALLQFFQLFPDLQKNDFYVTGESYAGKYVPAVCYAIHLKNQNASQQINLKGFAIGNGLSDPVNQLLFYAPYLYQIGLVDDSGMKQITAFEKTLEEYIKARRWMDAYDVIDKMINGRVTPYPTLFFNVTGYNSYYNYLHTEARHWIDLVKLFECPKVRRALHVGNLTFNDGTEVEMHLREDLMQSVAGLVGELLSHYRGVIYNGQLDIMVAYPPTERYLQALNFSSAAEYAKAPRGQWRVGKYLAGYAKTAGNLTQVLVRNAGHMVPADQPVAAADIIHRFTSNIPFF